jgi:outer membrane protein assembly factor BamB
MEPKTRLLVCIGLSALFLSACDFFLNQDPPGPPPEKAYRVDILWEREINSPSSYGSTLIEGQYGYLPAYENYPGGDRNIVKINMETGRVEWESRGIGRRHNPTGKPQKIGAHIYVPVYSSVPAYSGFIYIYNDSDGKLAATVMLGEDETEADNNAIGNYSAVAVSGAYLFWGSSDTRDSARGGLLRFDSRLIDFSKAPGEVQTITPELVWSNWQTRIYFNLISENGILYFLTRSMPEHPSVLVALDAETGDVIWEREAPHCQGDNVFSLVLNGEKLLVVERVDDIRGGTFSSYGKSTGIPVLENISMGHGTGWRGGITTLYNNRLFYSDNSGLVSVNANTGNLIWSISAWSFLPMFPNDQTLIYFRSSPLVNNGKVFIMHGTGLRVYDADTGKFIGVDKSFQKRWTDEIVIYKDLYIFYNGNKGYVTAIRCK